MTELLAVHVGRPQERGADTISDTSWISGIHKQTATGPVWLRALNLDGDGQADLKHHGGPDRAALAYSGDHYPIWRAELDWPDLAYGAFGENFTISGMDEDSVCVGDIYAIGATQVQVTQPRQPCWKLARRWQIKDLAARVEEKAWGGWYLRVLQEGPVSAGDRVELRERPYPDYSVRRVYHLLKAQEPTAETAFLAQLPALSADWREYFGRLK